MLYSQILRPLLFRFDSEKVHEALFPLGRIAELPPIQRGLAAWYGVDNPKLRTSAFGLSYANPLGLAAGFDKQCRMSRLLTALGFGHIEIGSITQQPQIGNPRPRIFRLEEDQALINRMGFPSEGFDAIAPRLKAFIEWPGRPVVGVSITKNRQVPIEGSTQDHVQLFNKVKNLADYVVLDVSCPNTPDAQELQQRGRLVELFSAIAQANQGQLPILVKLSPDLSFNQINEALEVALSNGIAGIIATNTSIRRPALKSAINETGGLSGAPLLSRSTEVVRFVFQETKGKLPIIGVGGIFSGQHAFEMISAGATLVQIYTAMIYRGPGVVKSILRDLGKLIDQAGVASVTELVGTGAKSTVVTDTYQSRVDCSNA